MQARIAMNPHYEKPEDQRQLFTELEQQIRNIEGPITEKLDRAGLEKLKNKLKEESKLISVK